MMNKYNSVPKLNLEPKLKRPLSLWNPFDYLRLLYWILLFPQAVGWYIDKFGSGNAFIISKDISNRLKLLHQKPIIHKLFIQGFLLIFFLLLIPTYQFGKANFSNVERRTSVIEHSQIQKPETEKIKPYSINSNRNLEFYDWFAEKHSFSKEIETTYTSNSEPWQWWFFIICYSIWIVIHIFILKPWKGISFSLTFGILLGIELSAFLWIGYFADLSQVKKGYFLHTIHILKAFLETAFDRDTLLGLLMGMVIGIICSISNSLHRKVELETLASLITPLALIMFGLFTNNLLFCIVYLLTVYLLVSRLESWLISCLFSRQAIFKRNWLISRLTPLPLPFISPYLKNWLEQNWEVGIYNANQLVKYTLQFIPVSKTINKTLATTSKAHLIYRISQLAAISYDWRLIHFASAPLNRKVKTLSKNTRTDTPVRATAAGFWYLHEKQPDKATEAFEKVRSLLYGEEVYTLAKTLATFHPVQELEQIASLDVPAFPQDSLLRPESWQALSSLTRVVEEVKAIQQSVSHTTKALALNRAIGELTTVLDRPEIPEAERELIIEIAQNWKRSLERIARDVGNVSITKPVLNPYVIGDPVQGSLFAGREDIMRQLQELWLDSNRLQSVVLYGHRRMGKTSILLNINSYIDAEIDIAYINLLRLGDSSQGVGEVLMQICDGIAEVTSVIPPSDDDLLKLPYRTFERYLKQVERTNYKSLIIAIDEFEKIEELIELRRIPTDFLGFLRGIVQMNPRIAVVFAGLHTLEEMTGDYFQPFFASVIPLHVGFLNRGATRQILANPIQNIPSPSIAESDDFVLDYTPQALDFIYQMTAGQPYLVQLIGFQLVRHYNRETFELGIARHPLFTVEDVKIIIDRQFFQQGRYYFEGVWGQAAQNVIEQQAIIEALAPYSQGLSEADLIAHAKIDRDTCLKAIAILKRHDVIVQTTTGWQTIVELFRLWVLDRFSR